MTASWTPTRAYPVLQGMWEEVGQKVIDNFYSVTSLAWKQDGSRLAIGNLCGPSSQSKTHLFASWSAQRALLNAVGRPSIGTLPLR